MATRICAPGIAHEAAECVFSIFLLALLHIRCEVVCGPHVDLQVTRALVGVSAVAVESGFEVIVLSLVHDHLAERLAHAITSGKMRDRGPGVCEGVHVGGWMDEWMDGWMK